MANAPDASHQDQTGQDANGSRNQGEVGTVTIRPDASPDELASVALRSTDELLLHPRLANLEAAERQAFLVALSTHARLQLALSEGCPDWIRTWDEDASLFLEVYRDRNFLLEDFVFDSEQTQCRLISRAEGRMRYRFEASIADCLLPENAEGLRRLFEATADPSSFDPEGDVWLPDVLEFGTLAEKDYEEIEFLGFGFSHALEHAVIDCRDDDPAELFEATKRLLDLSCDPEGFSQLLARLDHKEINDVQMQLNEALGEEEDHPLFSFDNIDAALDMDNDEGWRWSNYLKGQISVAMMMTILRHLDVLATATSRVNGDSDEDDDDSDYEDGRGWEPSPSILDASSPFQSLLGGAKSPESMYSFELTDLRIS